MTKYEECMVLTELLDVKIKAVDKRDELMKFINDNKEEYWLHIDIIRIMLDDLYRIIIDEINLINCARENNIIAKGIDYEEHYKMAENDMDFINKVKDVFSIE